MAVARVNASMDGTDVAVATLTWARTENESVGLARCLAALADVGLPVVVADRPAEPSFDRRLRALNNVTVVAPEMPGLVGQVKASIRAAAALGTRFVLYTEPDKERFFSTRLRDFVARAPAGGDVGVVLAARAGCAFDTFPPAQRQAEAIINTLVSETIGVVGDYSYGPFLMARTVADEVVGLPEHLGWGWRHATFVAAHRRGLAVRHITGDYRCPADQTTETADDRAHRLRQLSENIQGLIA
jgi:hypothetical protein